MRGQSPLWVREQMRDSSVLIARLVLPEPPLIRLTSGYSAVGGSGAFRADLGETSVPLGDNRGGVYQMLSTPVFKNISKKSSCNY